MLGTRQWQCNTRRVNVGAGNAVSCWEHIARVKCFQGAVADSK